MRLSAAPLFSIALALLGACAEPLVVRDIDGFPVPGRFISERAYALYARAADAEAHGDLAGALAGYSAASAEDPESAAIWTRVGAVRCAATAASGRKAPQVDEDAQEAFERAGEIDPAFAPLFRERARCAMALGQLAEADAASARALDLDPGDDGAAVVRARTLAALGRGDEAIRVLESAIALRPGAVEMRRELAKIALARGDRVTAARAVAALQAAGDPVARELVASLPQLSPLARVDAALVAGDLPAARREALRGHVEAAEVAARAAALGKLALAEEQAALVLGADPSSTTARIALATARDLAGDADGTRRALALDATPTSPSAIARLLYAELLLRRSGEAAARAWLAAWPQGAALAGDPLVARLTAQLGQRLGGG